MAKYDVTVWGEVADIECRDYQVDASSQEEAEDLARDLFRLEPGLTDYEITGYDTQYASQDAVIVESNESFVYRSFGDELFRREQEEKGR